MEVPLDPSLDPVYNGFPPAGPGVIPQVAISPDGSRVLQLVEPTTGPTADLVLADFPAGHRERLIEGLPTGRVPVWWSPDGRTIGYLIHGQSPDQGMWLVNADGTGRRKLPW
jgi:hypothetical protein